MTHVYHALQVVSSAVYPQSALFARRMLSCKMAYASAKMAFSWTWKLKHAHHAVNHVPLAPVPTNVTLALWVTSSEIRFVSHVLKDKLSMEICALIVALSVNSATLLIHATSATRTHT